MGFEALSPQGLDYLPCRYGDSKVLFRGPRRSLDAPFVAFFGGTTTYGKFIQTPFPELIEAQTELTCVNFGSLNGGIDVFACDPFLRKVSTMARATVIQITSPRNMSNRFYRVHPRRNDRLVEASALLRIIYRDVDFADFNFTNHMLRRLQLASPERFNPVVDELRAAWIARMRLVLSQIPGKIILLWASEIAPDENGDDIDADPAFITRGMLNEVIPMATAYAEVVSSHEAVEAGTEGMVFSQMETPAASAMLGPVMHREIANAVAPLLKSIL